MSKFKTLIVASALVVGVGTWAAASIVTKSGTQGKDLAASTQIDVHELMSKAQDLPVQTFDAI